MKHQFNVTLTTSMYYVMNIIRLFLFNLQTRLSTNQITNRISCIVLCVTYSRMHACINPLTPNDLYISRTTLLTSKLCILYIYSTNVGTEYFKHALYSPFFSLQNAVCFIMLTCLVPVLFKFYIQNVLKLKK